MYIQDKSSLRTKGAHMEIVLTPCPHKHDDYQETYREEPDKKTVRKSFFFIKVNVHFVGSNLDSRMMVPIQQLHQSRIQFGCVKDKFNTPALNLFVINVLKRNVKRN